MKFFLAVSFLLFTFPAFADDPQVIQGVNLVPAVCGPFYTALVNCPSYLPYDPEVEAKKTLNEKKAEPNCQMDFPSVSTSPQWVHSEASLPRTTFQQEHRAKFDSLSNDGEIYGGTYLVSKKSAMALYGDNQQLRDIYFLMPQNATSKFKTRMLFMDEGNDLAHIFNLIGATDLLQYGARGYPVVRLPNHIRIYEIDGNTSGPDTAQPIFSSRLVCEFASSKAAEIFSGSPTPVPGAASTYTSTGASPVTVPAPAPAAFDACTPYKDSNPAYYASCEDRRQKIKRMMDAGGSSK